MIKVEGITKPIVLKANEMEEAKAGIMEEYNIPSDRRL